MEHLGMMVAPQIHKIREYDIRAGEQCCQLLANVIGQKIRKIQQLAENFGHSHYFPIDAGFTAF
jgi:hypothetical protein